MSDDAPSTPRRDQPVPASWVRDAPGLEDVEDYANTPQVHRPLSFGRGGVMIAIGLFLIAMFVNFLIAAFNSPSGSLAFEFVFGTLMQVAGWALVVHLYRRR